MKLVTPNRLAPKWVRIEFGSVVLGMYHFRFGPSGIFAIFNSISDEKVLQKAIKLDRFCEDFVSVYFGTLNKNWFEEVNGSRPVFKRSITPLRRIQNFNILLKTFGDTFKNVKGILFKNIC